MAMRPVVMNATDLQMSLPPLPMERKCSGPAIPVGPVRRLRHSRDVVDRLYLACPRFS